MDCPNCGMPYEPGTTICPHCGTPLGNALYRPVDTRPGRKRRRWILILLLTAILSLFAYTGYHYYIKRVEKECLEVTEKLMECAADMDFTPIGADNLPQPLSENPNIRQILTDKIDKLLKDKGISQLLSSMGMEIDYDAVYRQLMSRAEYSIKGAETTYNRCTVTMTTSNVSYPDTMGHLKEKISDMASPATWWDNLKEWFSSILSGEKAEEKEDQESPSGISEWVKDFMDEQTVNTVTGSIVYGIKDGRWTLLSIDTGLLYNYYGFPPEQ